MNHIVCPTKYRRKFFSKTVEKTLKRDCGEISKRYELYFEEKGSDDDHVHFKVQRVPMNFLKKIVNKVKRLTAIEIFKLHPEVKTFLWGVNFGQAATK